MLEVAEVGEKLFSGKAPGADKIRLEILKVLDMVRQTRLFNVTWKSGTTPLEWQPGVTVPIFKKGDWRVCSNDRGLTLLILPSKVYFRVLERRFRQIVEPRIQEEQRGFHPDRGRVDKIRDYRGEKNERWAVHVTVLILTSSPL